MVSRRQPVVAAGPSRRSLPLAVPPACRLPDRARTRARNRTRARTRARTRDRNS